MAKTIKELAHQYVYENCDNDKHAIAVQCVYEAGANDVLEEIEKFANCTWGVKSLNTMSLKKMIKKLKGEKP